MGYVAKDSREACLSSSKDVSRGCPSPHVLWGLFCRTQLAGGEGPTCQATEHLGGDGRVTPEPLEGQPLSLSLWELLSLAVTILW